ncbi:cob(I)yrinic acid a,c-diamide adenosyltransferase [Puia dinghuensis]|uniref:Corrinoid adenosyltransferase n=1 Tax=Puia dinghuensis TaxID=1792502 RepID=A0A8J2UGY4_9BACT|nr:cob(I)yrinic acid a,c-diamide adenosyltransferase [Puia dinghuensis]GGB16182.1 cobalamin adenosyltransferase [Puia dinghuensis]
MAIRIYTKTGDKGTTSLIGGTKVSKSNLRIEAYGTVDELNSFIGLLSDQLHTATAAHAAAAILAGASNPEPLFSEAQTMLREIQDRLFTVGSSLACDPEKEPKLKIPDLSEDDLQLLEATIDAMEADLPPMKSFLLPGGHPAVSTAHIVRCVCRRAERCCVRMQDEQLFLEPLVLRYLNRLSDYFFVLARFIGHHLGVPEIPWKPRV